MTFPFRMGVADPVPLPAETDVVVIGGGVIGVTAALFLARAGRRVTLLEKGRVAAEQSSRNWGWIRVQGRDPAEIPIALEAQHLWRAFDAECGGRLGVRAMGVSYLARTEAQMAGYADWLEAARPFGVSSRIVERAGLARLLPGGQGPWVGALHTPTDMRGEPWVAVPELARLAREAGVELLEGCAVRALDRANGRISGVVTERGRIAAPEVVIAAGAWSGRLMAREGLALPQLSVRATALETGPLPQVVASAASDGEVAFRPRGDGGYTLAPSMLSELYLGRDAIRHARAYLPVLRQGGFDVKLRAAAPRDFPDAWTTARRWAADEESPFERCRILNPAPNMGRARAAARAFAAAFPELGPVPVRTAWAGMIDALPDVVPAVSRVAALPGLTVATGMCGHGFGIGPAFGRIVADLIDGRDPGHDLTRFAHARFTDGSPMRPGPNL